MLVMGTEDMAAGKEVTGAVLLRHGPFPLVPNPCCPEGVMVKGTCVQEAVLCITVPVLMTVVTSEYSQTYQSLIASF